MEKTVTLYGLSCESCSSLINRFASKHSVKVTSSDLETGSFTFDAENPQSIDALLSNLEGMGYSTKKVSGMHAKRAFSTFHKLLFTDQFTAEREMIFTAAFALMISVGLQMAAVSFLGLNAKFGKIIPFVVFLDVAVAATGLTLWHFFSVRKKVSCMTGMMVGMTIGMMAGFMIGYAFGPTNGMFLGSVLGVTTGIILGAWAGTTCGVMGTMEGMMAGAMSGTMGAMLSVMLLADNLLLFTVFFLIVCLLIIAAHFYMLLKEFGPVSTASGHVKIAGMIALVSLALVLVMLYGPKSGISIIG